MLAGTRFRVGPFDDFTNGLVTNGLPAWPRGRRLALAENPPHDQYDLRPVARMQLLHDVLEMHLHGTFRHPQIVSDRLVLLALLQDFEHLQFTRRQIDYAPF